MAYTFDAFLDAIGDNRYGDDALLAKLLDRYAGASRARDADLSRFGARVAGPLARLAEESAQPANAPSLRRFDAWHRRIDEIVLPPSTKAALAEVAGAERLGVLHGDPFAFYAKTYLAHQNGEAGVACSLACTDGMTRTLDALGDRAEHREALARMRASNAERVWHAAQFVTEIQGGSDVGANAVEARPAGAGAYELHGPKWFCSNVNADYYLVSARPSGAPAGPKGIAIFLVPAYLDGGTARNGVTIDRLKDKLGTRELATAELTFEGAVGWPIGPLDRGLANLVDLVLVTSRIACVLYAAASLRQAERIARAYATFRTAFGRPIADFAPVRRSLDEIAVARERSLAVAFELLRLWPARDGSADAADFRVLLSLAKPVITQRASTLLHEAVMLLGANGIEERFSPLPRLYRDAAVMETWEGPHNVLYAQAQRDIARLALDAGDFAHRMAGRPDDALASALSAACGGDEDAALAMPAAAARVVDALGDRVRGS
ncbi:MAG TPA: acyl-CoA dehydrogenase family protein [Casimicrobiaceae bacterium]|nr:acyl-CoA dehydrogenase family protein [Casimicrobiaceae bacterium]